MTAGGKPTFLLGLPALRDGALWQAARRLGAPVLVSANALSLWRHGRFGLREWTGFDRRNLPLVAEHPVWLDSAGFVAAARYNGFPWDVEDYLNLAAAAPWQGFFSQDWCVEPEVARDRVSVLDRLAGTVRLNVLCRNGAERRGILHRFAPVIQGWGPADYQRCLDRMPFALDFPVLGVGSMCRRHVGGPNGILAVVDSLDRALGDAATTLHLFGLKGAGMAAVRGHPRIASVDSQAYGTGARREAWRTGRPKSDAFLARHMTAWYRQQEAALAAPGYVFCPPPAPPPVPAAPVHPFAARVAAAAERLRELHEAGEIEWSGVSPLAAYEMAFTDDVDSFDEIVGADRATAADGARAPASKS